MNTPLAQDLMSGVWRELHKRRWFAKHVEDEEIDALWESLHDRINEVLKDHLG